MKTSSLLVARLALTLLIITSVTAAALAGVNEITKDRITAIQAEKTEAAISSVLPRGGAEIDLPAGAPAEVTHLYASDAGYAVEVSATGFGGTIHMMVGVDRDGKILGVCIISHSETPGLGASAAGSTPAGENFRVQFVGQTGVLAVTNDGGSVDALTGATITSRGVTQGVNAALACVGALD